MIEYFVSCHCCLGNQSWAFADCTIAVKNRLTSGERIEELRPILMKETGSTKVIILNIIPLDRL